MFKLCVLLLRLNGWMFRDFIVLLSGDILDLELGFGGVIDLFSFDFVVVVFEVGVGVEIVDIGLDFVIVRKFVSKDII